MTIINNENKLYFMWWLESLLSLKFVNNKTINAYNTEITYYNNKIISFNTFGPILWPCYDHPKSKTYYFAQSVFA